MKGRPSLVKDLYMLIGVPASGKSTFRDEIAAKWSATVISTDDHVESIAADLGITYDEAFTDAIGKATNAAKGDFNRALIRGDGKIIIDRTNLTPKSRRPWLQQASKAGYRTWAVVFTPPTTPDQKKQWDQRLRDRPGKTIPRNVLNNMLESFTLPEAGEGWFKIVHRNSWD